MAQYRTFEFDADDSTFELNQRQFEIIRPGLYHGFDLLSPSGLTLVLEHTLTGIVTIDENELETAPKGVYITKQSVTIKESSQIEIPVSIGGSLPRIDLVISEHLYYQVSGGTPAIYSIIKGTPAAIPVAPSLTNSKRQTILGELYVPANMSSLSDPGVVYTKSIQPDFAGNGFRSRIETLEESMLEANTEISKRLIASNNLSDVGSASQSRTNLGLGNHVTFNFIGSGGNYGSANNVARGDHAHSGVYEPVFSKNTGFNKNFGSLSGTVCEGSDSRLSDSRKCNNTFDSAVTSRTNLGLGNHVTFNFIGSGGNYGSANNVARGDHAHAPDDINGTLSASQIPNLPASKTTSGTFSIDRIPSLDASKIGSGTLETARIPYLEASKINSGTFSINRIPSIPYTKLSPLNYAQFVNNASISAASSISSLGSVNGGYYNNSYPAWRTYIKGSYVTQPVMTTGYYTQVYGGACPYLYIKHNGKYIFFSEIIKNAKYANGAKQETVHIPEYLLNGNKLEIRIKEEKDEVSFFEYICLSTTNGAKQENIFNKDLVLRKGEHKDFNFNLKGVDKKSVFIDAFGFYLPLQKNSI